jgi:hypothetical protein
VLKPEVKKAVLNPAFLLAYAHYTGKPLENGWFEKELDFDAKDGIEFLTRLYECLKESTVQINFNSDLFTQQLVAFNTLRKTELPEGFQPGVLKLMPQALLGLFSLSDSLLLPDFEYLQANQIPLEDLFLKEAQPTVSPLLEKNLLVPFTLDGSQEQVLRTTRAGKSVVVQGPPGTGKSQVIATLISDAIASGKSVLLVCQKKVALDVVFQRLSTLGIQEHLGMWADYKKDITQVYQQIARHIDRLEETESKNNGLDTVVLERRFTQLCNDLDVLSARFEEWRLALFDETVAGISFLEIGRSNNVYLASEVQPPTTKLFRDFQYQDWSDFLSWMDRHYSLLWESHKP